MTRYILSLVLLAGSGLLIFWSWPRETPPPTPVYAQLADYTGNEDRQEGALHLRERNP